MTNVPPENASNAPRRNQVTLKSLAKQLGVSAMTVSNAFNRPAELSDSLRERILASAAEAGYHGPRPSGRMLRTGIAGAIALSSPDPVPCLFEDSNASAFMAGISEVCEKHQFGLTVLPPMGDISRGTAIDRVAVDGFILYAFPEQSSIVKRVLGRQLPTVTVDMSKLPEIAAVGTDDRKAAKEIAEHVLQFGHRRIAVLSQEMMSDGFCGLVDSDRIQACEAAVTQQRLLGYIDALKEAGIDPAAVPIYEIRASDYAGASYWIKKLLKKKHKRPTAVFAMSDQLALRALEAADRLGLKVPKEVSIVGFDDFGRGIDSKPSLSTIRQPWRAKGRLAASIVVGDRPYPTEFQLLPAELDVRKSVGRPRTVKGVQDGRL